MKSIRFNFSINIKRNRTFYRYIYYRRRLIKRALWIDNSLNPIIKMLSFPSLLKNNIKRYRKISIIIHKKYKRIVHAIINFKHHNSHTHIHKYRISSIYVRCKNSQNMHESYIHVINYISNNFKL